VHFENLKGGYVETLVPYKGPLKLGKFNNAFVKHDDHAKLELSFIKTPLLCPSSPPLAMHHT